MRTPISRRTALQGILTGAAATAVPVMAAAAPAFSDGEELDVCIRQLTAILGRLHPNANNLKTFYTLHSDGGYSLWQVGLPHSKEPDNGGAA